MSPKGAGEGPRRSRRARHAIHTATRELVSERGFADVTIEAIAARAGVGKQTIYRWWSSKSAVVLDVLVADRVSDGEPVAPPNTGDLVTDVRAALFEIVDYFTDTANDNLLRAMTAEMQYDDELATTILETLLRPQFDLIVARIGVEDLTTSSGGPSDPEVVAEMLVGPIFHRWLLRRAPLDHAYIDRLIEHVLGHAREGRDGGPSRRRRR